MHKLIAIAVVAAVTSFAAVPPGMAQTLTVPSPIVMADHSMRAGKLIGLTVTDDHGQKLGTIVDVLVKGEAAEPMVILSTGKKMVAAPLSHISIAGTKLTMPNTTATMIASMPAYNFSGLNGGG